MNRHITVTLVTVTETLDDIGGGTESPSSTAYDAVRFAPRGSSESTNNDTPRVITSAALYRRGEFPVNETDRIVIAGQHPLIDGTWKVQGDVGRWASGVEVAIQRTA